MYKSKQISYFPPCILNKGATFRVVILSLKYSRPAYHLKGRLVYVQKQKISYFRPCILNKGVTLSELSTLINMKILKSLKTQLLVPKLVVNCHRIILDPASY